MPHLDRRLLDHYNRELEHLRSMGAEFARQYPKIAGRLALNEDGVEICPDPYVERLLEGFAFLAARVHMKIDAEFPRFTNALLRTVFPQYLSPLPSMAIAQFEPDWGESSLAEGFTVPRHTSLRSALGKGEQTRCEYRTAHEVTLWPVRIVDAGYHVQDLGTLQLPSLGGAQAALRIRLRGEGVDSLSQLAGLDRLPIYLRGQSELPMRIYEELMAHALHVVVQPAQRPATWHERKPAEQHIHRKGFEDDEALLPVSPAGFQGYRLLEEYFAFPQRFMFTEISGLSAGLSRCEDKEVDVIVTFDRSLPELEKSITADQFALYTTPVINLFPKRTDRIHISDRFAEFQVLPDRTRPLDFEVYDVRSVTGYGKRQEDRQEFRPFYGSHDRDHDDSSETTPPDAYFTQHRVPRTLSERERRGQRRSVSYGGSEVYLSLVDGQAAPYRSDLSELAVQALCTNRDLPLHMAVGQGESDFFLEGGEPVRGARCLDGPTKPRPSRAEGATAWRLISHLSLNYLSLTNTSEREGASALREMLDLYADVADRGTRQHAQGLRSVKVNPITRRVVAPGPITFARGLEVALEFDESYFEGVGVFLLGAVMEQFLAKYVSINSFTEAVVHTEQRGELMRWPARIGIRQLI